MTKAIFILLLVLGVSTGFTQNLVIKGNIKSREALKIYVSYFDKVDSVTTKNGIFKFSLDLPTAALVRVVAAEAGNMRKNATRSFFADNGLIQIKATSLEDYRNVPIAGIDTLSQGKYNAFTARFNPLVKVARTYIDKSYDSGRTEPEKRLLNDLYDNINQIEDEVAKKFVLENTDNAVGAYVFYRYLQQEKNVDNLESIYKLFDPSLYPSTYLVRMREKIDHMKKLVPGQPAPLFSSITSDNQSFHLDQLIGKYVVLDFWGSWCEPCLKGLPKMKAYYAKYKNSVKFVSIACNDENASWRNAIKNNDLRWIQILNDVKAQDLSKLYNILAFPTKIIIGKKGELLGIYKGENEAFYTALDKFIKP